MCVCACIPHAEVCFDSALVLCNGLCARIWINVTGKSTLLLFQIHSHYSACAGPSNPCSACWPKQSLLSMLAQAILAQHAGPSNPCSACWPKQSLLSMLAQAILAQHAGPNDPYSVHAHPVVTQSTRYLTGYFKSSKI